MLFLQYILDFDQLRIDLELGDFDHVVPLAMQAALGVADSEVGLLKVIRSRCNEFEEHLVFLVTADGHYNVRMTVEQVLHSR